MQAKAYIKNKQAHIFFKEPETAMYSMFEYKLGAALVSLLCVNTEELEVLYNEIIVSALDIKTGRLTEEQGHQLSLAARAINEKCVYLIYYTDILLRVLISVVTGKLYDMSLVFTRLPHTNDLYEQYSQRFEEDSDRVDEILAPYYSQQYLESRPRQQKIMMLRSINNILYIKDALLIDINEKKKLAFEAVSLLHEDGDEQSAARQRLASLFEFAEGSIGPLFTNREFSVSYRPFIDGMPADAPFAEKTGDESIIEAYELYSVDWVDDLICFEILKVVENLSVIKKCANCARFFVPMGRADAIYCTELFEETGKTCAEIGAVKKYKDKTASSPAYEAFNKAYKRNNSRVRNGKMTKEEFAVWLEDAKKMRAECAEGKIEAAFFSKWLGNKK